MNRRNGSRKLEWFILMIFISFGAGCASTQETSTLQQSIGVLHERVQTLERRLEGVDVQGKKSADVYSRMEELQMRLGAINGRVEELDHRIEQLSRASAAQAPQTPPPAQGPAPTLSIPPASSAPPIVTSPSFATPPSPKGAPPQPAISIPEKEPSDKAAYDRASQLFQQGQFEGARKEFQSFVGKYPKSELADNALYSVGECYLSEKRYQDAIEVFQQVLDRYPKGDKVPHALLKQGTAFQSLGDSTAARILYERLVEKYPDSQQAQIAQKKLKQLR